MKNELGDSTGKPSGIQGFMPPVNQQPTSDVTSPIIEHMLKRFSVGGNSSFLGNSLIHRSGTPKLRAKRSRIANVEQSPSNQFLMADDTGCQADGKHVCFYNTLFLFKEHLQNRLSNYPDPLYVQKVNELKRLMDENDVDLQQFLGFFMTEMKNFVSALTTDESMTKGMELLDNAFSASSSAQAKDAAQRDSVDKATYIPGIPKKNQHCCRACKHYFEKSEEHEWICEKDECQARKCQNCKAERVISIKGNKGLCDPCTKAKNSDF